MRTYIETNFETILCCLINFYVLKFSMIGDLLSSVTAILLMTITLVATAVTFYLVNKSFKQQRLDDPVFESRFGELYSMFNIKKRCAVLYNFLFILRRSVTILSLVYVGKLPGFQIGILLWMCTFWAGYSASVKPHTDLILNKLEFVNEILYGVLLHITFLFTDYCNDKMARSVAGWTFVVVLLLLLLLNAFFLITTYMVKSYRK